MKITAAKTILLAAVLSAGGLLAEEFVPIWPEGKMPFSPKKDVVIGPETVSEKGIVKNVTVPGFEVFLPENKSSRGNMAIIICPGGAYGCLDYEREGRRTARYLQKIGVAAFVMKYRLRQYPAKARLADLQRAMAVVRANAKKWNISPNYVGVMGYSAGGHLAMRSVAKFGERVYEKVDEIDEQSADPSFGVFVYAAYLTKDNKGAINEDVKPALKPGKRRLFMVSGLTDLYRHNTVDFFTAHVKANKWPSIEAHFFPDAGHGFGVTPRAKSDAVKWERLLATWLRRIGRGIKANVSTADDTYDLTPIEISEAEAEVKNETEED